MGLAVPDSEKVSVKRHSQSAGPPHSAWVQNPAQDFPLQRGLFTNLRSPFLSQQIVCLSACIICVRWMVCTSVLSFCFAKKKKKIYKSYALLLFVLMSAKLEGEKVVVFVMRKQIQILSLIMVIRTCGRLAVCNTCTPTLGRGGHIFWDVVSVSQNCFFKMFSDDIPNLLDGMNYILW